MTPDILASELLRRLTDGGGAAATFDLFTGHVELCLGSSAPQTLRRDDPEFGGFLRRLQETLASRRVTVAEIGILAAETTAYVEFVAARMTSVGMLLLDAENGSRINRIRSWSDPGDFEVAARRGRRQHPGGTARNRPATQPGSSMSRAT
ncbi:MAG: hypothetical protein ABI224_10885 [Acetobacteraceae bacterium]